MQGYRQETEQKVPVAGAEIARESPAQETLISRTHLFLPHDLPPTKKVSPDFEGPFRQLLKSSAREKNQV
jgi:hypothetical protein